MDCNQALGLISQRLDDRLSVEQEQSLARHLAGCPACHRIATAMVNVDAMLAASPSVSAPREMVGGVMARVSRRARVERIVQRVLVAALCVALFLVVVVFPGARAIDTAGESRLLMQALWDALGQLIGLAGAALRPLAVFLRTLFQGQAQQYVLLWVLSAVLLVIAWVGIVSRAIRPVRQEIPFSRAHQNDAARLMRAGQS